MNVFYFIEYIIKIISYAILFFIAAILGLKLWLEPVKGVCKCKTKLHGKVALITGGNSGIGLETARDLAKRGARVIIACRNNDKSKEAVADIIKTTGNNQVEYKHLDLSKFDSIKNFVEDFNKNYDALHILVNNAGAGGLKHAINARGIDVIVQINYIGPFLLTNLLMDKLVASKPSRIVVVSSYGHYFHNFKVEDLFGKAEKSSWKRYANSKLCNVLWTKALAGRIPNGVTANCLHPGVVKTDIFKRMPDFTRTVLLWVIDAVFKTPEEGAQCSIHLCVAPELDKVSGEYFSDCKVSAVAKLADDNVLIEEVWKRSMDLINVKI